MPSRLGSYSLSLFLLVSVGFIGCGGGSSSSNSGSGGAPTPPDSSSNPVPTLSSITPASTTSGSSGLSVTLSGSNFISTSTAQWNGTALSTSYTSATTLTAQIPASDLTKAGNGTVTVSNPSPGGGTSKGLTFVTNQGVGSGVTAINVTANDLAWDPVNKVIYLSLPSADGANGNTVQVLDPTTGTLGATASVGSEPNLLAVSKSNKYLYVSLNGASNVQRMTLPNLGRDITIPLGSDPFFGPFYAMDLQAGPASDGTVAVVRELPNVMPQEEGGVVIYDDGTARPDSLCGGANPQPGCIDPFGVYDSIQWNSDGSEMFAANNETSGWDFYTIPITQAGFGAVTDYPNLVGNGIFGNEIHYDAVTNDIYDDNGSVIDPITGTILGGFNASGIMVPDGSLGTAFFLGQVLPYAGDTTYTLESFDIRKFTPIATITIQNVIGTPTHLIRWGSNGLAFTTANSGGSSSNAAGAVYLISGSFVSGSKLNLKSKPTQNVRRTWKLEKQPAQAPLAPPYINR